MLPPPPLAPVLNSVHTHTHTHTYIVKHTNIIRMCQYLPCSNTAALLLPVSLYPYRLVDFVETWGFPTRLEVFIETWGFPARLEVFIESWGFPARL